MSCQLDLAGEDFLIILQILLQEGGRIEMIGAAAGALPAVETFLDFLINNTSDFV